MNQQPIHSMSEDTLPMFRSELLKAIVEDDISSWNSDAFNLCDCLDDDELTSSAETLFSNLNECWSKADTSVVKLSLWERFGQLVPSNQLDKIMSHAQEIVSLNLSPLEQLIQCVKPLLSNWSEDDLQIFARPLVSSMRGTAEFKQAPWDDLSQIDQARLTMRIAQEAIYQLQKQNSQTITELDG